MISMEKTHEIVLKECEKHRKLYNSNGCRGCPFNNINNSKRCYAMSEVPIYGSKIIDKIVREIEGEEEQKEEADMNSNRNKKRVKRVSCSEECSILKEKKCSTCVSDCGYLKVNEECGYLKAMYACKYNKNGECLRDK